MKSTLLSIITAVICLTASAQLKFEDHLKNGQTKLDQKNFNGAYQEFQAALNSKQTEINKYIKTRKDYDKLTEFEKASLESVEAISPRNDYAQPYYLRGLAQMGLGKSEEAYKDFDLAIYIDEKYAGPYYERGKIRFAKGDKDLGCIDIRTAADLGSAAAKEAFDDNFCWTNSVNYLKEGNTKLTLRLYDAAVIDFNLAIKLNPDSAGNYAKRGECYHGMGKFGEAIKDFNRAIELNPENQTYYYQRGLAYYSWEKHNLAFDDFCKALRMDPNYTDALLYRAYSCEAQGNWKSAIYDYGQIIRIKPEDGFAYYRRGLAKQESKDKTACTDFKKAAALGNEDAADFAAGCK